MAATRPLIAGWLAALEAERDRRTGHDPAAAEWLLAELEEMGRRLLAVTPAGSTRVPEELAQKLAQAKSWSQIDELRIPADLSRAEAVALAMIVNPEAAVRQLNGYAARVMD
jgi:hypothetical protein